MDSDESSTVDDPELAASIARQRAIVTEYLASQRCAHGGVSVEPRYYLEPYVALWAIRSRTNPDRVGWWAISGDLPTDYMSAGDQTSSADVMLAFAKQWQLASERMAQGESLDDYTVGDPSRAKELAPLLKVRADLLQQLAGELVRAETEENP